MNIQQHKIALPLRLQAQERIIFEKDTSFLVLLPRLSTQYVGCRIAFRMVRNPSEPNSTIYRNKCMVHDDFGKWYPPNKRRNNKPKIFALNAR